MEPRSVKRSAQGSSFELPKWLAAPKRENYTVKHHSRHSRSCHAKAMTFAPGDRWPLFVCFNDEE